MSALSDRIAAEHLMPLGRGCVCDPGVALSTSHAAHVADVTERAVRDAIAQQLENLEFTNAQAKQLVRDGWTVEWTAGHDHAIYKAAELAREGTTQP